MIIVRDVFRLKFGRAKEVKALWKEGAGIETQLGGGPSRAMVDLIGPYYTLVLESTFKDLADFERVMANVMGSPAFATWYQKLVPLVEEGYREVYTVLE